MNIQIICKLVMLFALACLTITGACAQGENRQAQLLTGRYPLALSSLQKPLTVVPEATPAIAASKPESVKQNDSNDCRRKASDPYWHVYCYYYSSKNPEVSDDIDRLQNDLGWWVIFEKCDQDKDLACQKLGVCSHTPSGAISHPGIREENNTWDSWHDEPLTYLRQPVREVDEECYRLSQSLSQWILILA